ncbi:replication initiation and membrane attachment family protein [Bacillus sp. T3]|uniref:replication initiation and membrane attachment family protein n=1 Tax=Bacillus sp. T3 TaxID=467262 RepID=UPI002980A55D|nr:DnaD domain protein [Bacillus sp. T3]
MTQHWQEIIPIDRYVVNANGLLHEYDRKVLTFLYQPLIGAKSLSLYMTLWGELEENRLWSKPSSHHRLMLLMDLNLNEIYDARLRLEGMNLLTTLVRDEQEERDFIYQLKPPLAPDKFFTTDLLNIPLYRKIGDQQYARIKQFFSTKRAEGIKGFQNVTKGYEEVFELIPPSAMNRSPNMFIEKGQEHVSRRKNDGIQLAHSSFNFELLTAGLTENLVPKSALTEEVKEAISQLAYLYGIDAIQMKNIVIDATDHNVTDISALRKYARDWFEFHHGGLPTLVDRTQPVLYKSIQTEPNTEEEKQISYFENTSPRQVLRDTGGGEPSKVDLKIIEDILFQQKLQPGVVNVLIQFVMYKMDMKLPKSYIEKIASHWARKKINNVKDAMTIARSEYKEYQQWAPKDNNNKKKTTQKKATRTELLPDWFNETGNQKPAVQVDEVDDTDFEAKKRELQEKIKNLRK